MPPCKNGGCFFGFSLPLNAGLAAEIYNADFHDAATLEDSFHQAQINQQEAGSEQEIKDAVADKGYHSTETITNLDQYTTYRSTFASGPTRRRSESGPCATIGVVWPATAARVAAAAQRAGGTQLRSRV